MTVSMMLFCVLQTPSPAVADKQINQELAENMFQCSNETIKLNETTKLK